MPPLSVDHLLANLEGMRRLAHRLVRDPHAADDVAQDALLVALTRGPRHGRNLRGWLNGIVRNVARDRTRSDVRRVHREAKRASAESPPEPPELAVQAAEQKRLIDAVMSLQEPYRSAIWRRYFENKPPRVIAREDGVPVETVRTWVKRAHALLRTRLDEAHGGDRRAWALALAPFASASSGASIPLAVGGVIMSAKSKAVALAAAVLLLGVTAFFLTRGQQAPDSGPALADGTIEGSADTLDTPTLDGERGSTSLAADDDAPIDPSLLISGRVVDERGEPLGGVEIRSGQAAEADLAALTGVAQSGPDGSFAFAGPADQARQRVVAQSPGRLPAHVVLRPGTSESPTLRLPRVPTYYFRVLDRESDAPLVGVSCETRRRAHGMAWIERRQTDASGLVSIRSPVAHDLDSTLPIRFQHAGYTPLLQITRHGLGRASGTKDNPRDIYLAQTKGLVLVVQDEGGTPVPGARVRAWAGSSSGSPIGPEWEVHYLGTDLKHDALVFLGEATSDEEGRVRLGAPPNGQTWHARAETTDAIGFAWRGRLPRAGKREDVIRLMPAYTVRGRVMDVSGAPASNVVVQTMPWPYANAMVNGGRISTPPAEVSAGHHTRTDADGRYELALIGFPAPPHEVSLGAQRGDIGHAFVRLTRGAAKGRVIEADIRYEKKYEFLPVRVVDEEGLPVAGAVVAWRGMLPGSITDAEGRTKVMHVPGVRKGNLMARHPGRATVNVTPAEGAQHVELVMPKAATLTGRVVDPKGAPRAVYIDVYDADVAEMKEQAQRQIFVPHWQGRTEADASGRFHLVGLRPGPWFVSYWYSTKREGKHHTVRGTAVVSGDEPVELTLPEEEPDTPVGSVVRGTVVDAAGQPTTDYFLYLRQPGEFRGASALGPPVPV